MQLLCVKMARFGVGVATLGGKWATAMAATAILMLKLYPYKRKDFMALQRKRQIEKHLYRCFSI